VVYPEGVWYHIRDKTDVDTVLQQHVVAGDRARGLMLAGR
jgi:(2Fe-2S) ferredoxin